MSAKPEKVYLLTYSLLLGTKEQVKNCLDQIPQVINWRAELPSTFYIISECEKANELADLLTACMGKKGRFLIIEVGPGINIQGWLPPDAWHFLKRKTAQELEAAKLPKPK